MTYSTPTRMRACVMLCTVHYAGSPISPQGSLYRLKLMSWQWNSVRPRGIGATSSHWLRPLWNTCSELQSIARPNQQQKWTPDMKYLWKERHMRPRRHHWLLNSAIHFMSNLCMYLFIICLNCITICAPSSGMLGSTQLPLPPWPRYTTQ